MEKPSWMARVRPTVFSSFFNTPVGMNANPNPKKFT